MSILLLISLIFITIIVFRKCKTGNIAWPLSVAMWVLLVYIVTEVQSAFRLIGIISDLITWATVVTLLLSYLLYEINSNGLSAGIETNGIKKMISGSFDKYEIIMCCIVIFVVFMTGIASVLVVPNNWDSMTYHLPRIMHWVQNRSVGYYFTANLRQLCSPPLAEYIVMHVYLLSFGSDQYLNLVQFFGFIFSLIGIYCSCKCLCKKKFSCIFAAALFATAPIAIAEATTTQVDLIASALYTNFLSLVVSIFMDNERIIFEKQKVGILIGIAILCGLEFLTKNSICVCMAILMLALFVHRMRKKDELKILFVYATLCICVVGCICFPVFYRNEVYFGDILASSYFSSILVGTWNPKYLIVNVYKNFCLLLVNSMNKDILCRLGYDLGRILRIDIDDPSVNFTPNRPFYDSLVPSYSHDAASVTILSTLFCITFVIMFITCIFRNREAEERDKIISVMLISSLALFIITKYQPWGVRLFMVCIVNMCVYVPLKFEEIHLNRRVCHILFCVVIALFIYTSLMTLRWQGIKLQDYKLSGESRYRRYFINRADVADLYWNTCNYINSLNIKEVGLLLTNDEWEYPIWKGITKDVIFNYVDLENTSEIIPDILIVSQNQMKTRKTQEFLRNNYLLVYNDNTLLYVYKNNR